MAPTFVDFTVASPSGGGSTDLAATLPTGTVSGDFQLAVISIGTSSETINTVPAGWMLIGALAGNDADTYQVAVYYSTTATGTSTWVKSGNREARVVRASWTNHGGIGSVAGPAVNGTGTTHATPSVTPTEANSMVIGGAAIDNASSVTYTPPGSWTERVDSYDFLQAITLADITAGPSATTGTFTSSASDEAITFAVVLNPAGAATKPTLVSGRGTVADTTAATTSSVTLLSPTAIAVGNYLLARVAVDNSGASGAAPGCTVTDPRSNTWTVLGPALIDPGAAAAGATAYLAYTRVVTAYQAADALTFNWGGISTTAKAVVVEEWTNIAATSPVAVSTVTASAAASTTVQVSITPTAPNQLVYTCLATEGIAGDTVGADTDTTNGTWTTLPTTASANATATNNQRVSGQYKIVTASGAQSWDSTITSRDWAALAVVFTPPISLPPPQPIRRLNIGALLDL